MENLKDYRKTISYPSVYKWFTSRIWKFTFWTQERSKCCHFSLIVTKQSSQSSPWFILFSLAKKWKVTYCCVFLQDMKAAERCFNCWKFKVLVWSTVTLHKFMLFGGFFFLKYDILKVYLIVNWCDKLQNLVRISVTNNALLQILCAVSVNRCVKRQWYW